MSIAETLEGYLNDRDAAYSLQFHRPSTSSLASAHSAHIDEGNLAKSVVLEDDDGFVIAVLPASHRLDLGRVREEVGRALRLSTERELLRLFPDCEPGAIPPIGAAYGLPTVIDSSVESCGEIYFEGGDHETLIRMEGPVFLDLLENSTVAEISNEMPVLTETRYRRRELGEAQELLRRAIDAPRTQDGAWRRRVEVTLKALVEGLDAHVFESEAPLGILREIELQAPRLWREVDALREDHDRLGESCREIDLAIESGESEDRLRARCHALLERLALHRHRGADLVFRAFGVDLGGG